MNTVTQYNAPNVTSRQLNYFKQGAFISNPSVYLMGEFVNPTAPAQGYDYNAVFAEADRLRQQVGDANGLYIIMSGPGNSSSEIAPTGSFCAWHGTTALPTAVAYVPYMSDIPNGLCGGGSVTGPMDGFGIALVHELAETETDPISGTGWMATNREEIGDKCESQPFSALTLSTGTYAVQSLWSNVASACVFGTPRNYSLI